MSKKKILLIPTYFPTKSHPVLGSVVKEQIDLVAENFDIKVLYCINKGTISKKRYYLEKLLNSFGFLSKESCVDDILCDSLDKRGVYYYGGLIGSSQDENFKLVLETYFSEFQKLLNEGWVPDLIHARVAEHAGIIAYHLSKKFSIPYVVTEDCALLCDDAFSTFKMDSYFKSLSGAVKVAFASNYLLRLVSMHGKKVNGEALGNMVNENRFFINKPKSKPDSPFRILTVGYFSYIKDFDTFYKAIQFVVQAGFKNIEVTHLVTYTWSKENVNELVDLIKSYGVERFCNLKYEISRSEMPIYINNSDVFVSTSLTETFGIAACEALFCGVPVVTTANGGVDDFISDANGIKVPIKDYVAIAKAIISIMKGEVRFEANAVRQSVVDKFGFKAFKPKLNEFYKSAILENKA